MESLFFVGQKVVALVNSISDGTIVKGKEYEVLEIKKVCCLVCVRVTANCETVNNICARHNTGLETTGKFFDQEAFAPVQEMGSMTYEDAIAYVQPKALQL